MLKKNTPVKFTKPVSTMRTVLAAVEHGFMYRHDILTQTCLKDGQVQAALYNLTFCGLVTRSVDANGRSIYLVPGRQYGVAKCLCGVRSIFDVR